MLNAAKHARVMCASIALITLIITGSHPLLHAQVVPAVSLTEIADAIRWFDTLGFPDTRNLSYGRASTGLWTQSGNQARENSYIEGFVVGNEPEAFTLFATSVPIYLS